MAARLGPQTVRPGRRQQQQQQPGGGRGGGGGGGGGGGPQLAPRQAETVRGCVGWRCCGHSQSSSSPLMVASAPRPPRPGQGGAAGGRGGPGARGQGGRGDSPSHVSWPGGPLPPWHPTTRSGRS